MSIRERILNKQVLVSLAVGVFAFGVYFTTLAPGIDFIDAGELTTVAWTLGIAHPTGYPLFSLLGWVFAHLPIAHEPVVRLNIMAALFCAAGVSLYLNVFLFILRRFFQSRDQGGEDVALASAGGAALLLAFSETYWSQAVAVEVYSLHLLLVAAVMLSFLKANEATGEQRWWILFAFLLGLAFTNHMTTVLLAPGCLVYYFVRQGWHGGSWKRIVTMVAPFLLGFSVYLYLPVRAWQGPVMNWGEPVNLERFLWHFSAKQFRVWIFSSSSVAGRQFAYFIDSLPAEHAYIGLVLAALGAVALWKKSTAMGLFTLLLFAGCVGYAINYDIHDIDSYFLLAYIVIGIWAACGLFVAGRWALRKGWHAGRIALVIAVAGLVPLAVHYRVADESGNYLVDDYAQNMFASLEPNAVILSTQWDFWVSASYYMQLVRHERTDIVVIDKELLRRSWYFKQLERRHPWLVEQSRSEINAFMVELDKFEHGVPYDPEVIQMRYVAMIRSFISRNIGQRPVYVTWDIEDGLTAHVQRVPRGLALQLYADTVFHPVTIPEFTYRPFGRRGRLEDATLTLYADAYAAFGQYALRWGNLPAAEKAFKRALFFDPSHQAANRWLRLIESRVHRPT